MNREIKFRAWDKASNRMLMPDVSDWEDLAMELSGELFRTYESGYERTRLRDWVNGSFELMQYTGLKDKNGTEIYEGDVVRTVFYNNEYMDAIVKFGDTYDVMPDDGYYGWYLEVCGGNIDTTSKACQLNSSITYTATISGNIHQNPELLNK